MLNFVYFDAKSPQKTFSQGLGTLLISYLNHKLLGVDLLDMLQLKTLVYMLNFLFSIAYLTGHRFLK